MTVAPAKQRGMATSWTRREHRGACEKEEGDAAPATAAAERDRAGCDGAECERIGIRLGENP